VIVVVVGRVLRAPIGTEHFRWLSFNELARFSVIKFMLEPVSSRALQRSGCVLSFRMLTRAVTNRS
jgi:hypothetical protein